MRRPGHPYLAGRPLLIAHRGGAALAPENTLEAFSAAVRHWRADILEMDVHLSADGEVVVIHDGTVDRTTDGTGAVARMTWSELHELDAGFHFIDPDGERSFRGRGVRVPRLTDLLEAFPGIRFNVDSKVPEAAAPLARVIARHGAEHRVLVSATLEKSRRGARGYRGPWGASRRQITRFWILHRFPSGQLATPRADALQVPEFWKGHRVLTPRFVREAHRRNLPVHVWTVDEVSEMERFLDWGVDGIQTDRPDRLARLLHERVGRPLPEGA